MKIEELYKILLADKPSYNLKEKEEELFNLIPELKICKGFNQKSVWHIYDVYEHTMHVIDNVLKNLNMRLAALFHDIGKPLACMEDEMGVRHFHGHWEFSQKIFIEFANIHKIDKNICDKVSQLIYYHDINFDRLDDIELKKVIDKFDINGIKELFEFKRADLLAQNPRFNYVLNEYDIWEKKIIEIKGEVL